MSEWKEYKLGELLSINVNSIGRNYPYKQIEYLDTGSITRGKIENIQFFDLRHAPSRAKRLVKDDDIIYSTVRPIQRHYGIIKNPNANLVVSTGFAVLSCDEKKADAKFIYYFLTSDESVNYLDMVAEGATSAYPSLTPDVIADMDILLPPLPEQKSIAFVLSSLDDKIDLLHRQNKTLEVLAETLFRQWFVRRPELAEGEEAEEGWETGKLGDYVQFIKGKKPNKSFEEYSDSLMPQILIETFDTGKTLFSETQNMVIANEKDILMVMDGASSGRVEIGYAGIVGSTIGLFKPVLSFNCPLFIFYFLKSNESYIREHTTGSAIPHADKALILNLDIQFSRIERVIEFERTAGSWFEKKKANKQQIRTLTRLRDTLLPKLMSGEVRVKEKDNKTE